MNIKFQEDEGADKNIIILISRDLLYDNIPAIVK